MLDLNIIPPIIIANSTDVNFWEAFKQSLNCNKSGPYNRTRILSIIAEKFAYSELQEKLQSVHFSIANFSNNEISRPEPVLSSSTTPKNKWTMARPREVEKEDVPN
ncbi:16540_t:CDS:2, partial [Gigaspora rosea]